MDLYKEILIQALAHQTAEVTFPNLNIDAKSLVDSVCYRALLKIRDIVRDETLPDPECFSQIEEIISALEKAGSDGGFRHDFA